MRTIQSLSTMQKIARQWRRAGRAIGFVPTMGCLHDGHLRLIERARRAVGKAGKVVVSVYVNPIQFGPGEDFSRYPRNWHRDQRRCREAGVDLLFAPRDDAMYSAQPGQEHSTFVLVERLTGLMEGRSRPTHFRGVTTVVAKLFHLVQPDVAVFGAKDWQQASVLRRMVRDLNFPVRMVVAPTVREKDGLALSSRNQYLSASEREQAGVLWRVIREARASVRLKPNGVPAARLKERLSRLVADCPDARLDYLEFFEPETLRPLSVVRRGARLALAVFFGKTRLIDNGGI
jgi:pantoate--beta-alanine ligase